MLGGVGQAHVHKYQILKLAKYVDIQTLNKIDLTRTDVMAIDLSQVDLVEIDLVRIDLVIKKW